MSDLVRSPKLPPRYLDQLASYARNSRAPTTQRIYASQWRLFEIWCASVGLDCLPASSITVAAYLAERAASGGRVATIEVALAAIAFVHTAAGTPLSREHPELGLVMAGIRRQHAAPQRQAEPLRAALLREVLQAQDPRPASIRNAALLSLLYTFALRPSEVVALDWQRRGSGHGWLELNARTIGVVLCSSKAAKDRSERLTLPARAVPLTSHALRRWVRSARLAPGEPLLRGVTRDGGVRPARLHVDSVGAIVKRSLFDHFSRSGLSAPEALQLAHRFSGHSGRVGLCVTSAEAGAPAQLIAAIARHRGLAMARRYCEQADLLRCAPHLNKQVGV